MSRVGRPRKEVDLKGLDLIDLDECVRRLQLLWDLDEPPYTRRTLQNKISRNEFHRYGPYHKTMVDWNEVKQKELKKRAG